MFELRTLMDGGASLLLSRRMLGNTSSSASSEKYCGDSLPELPEDQHSRHAC